jgi:hypothetical protein
MLLLHSETRNFLSRKKETIILSKQSAKQQSNPRKVSELQGTKYFVSSRDAFQSTNWSTNEDKILQQIFR